jgi:Icc protein
MKESLMLIAHITDTHIVDKGDHYLSEPSTQVAERLAKAISYLNDLNPLPDAVLLTGDVTDHGSPAAYSRFKELIAFLRPPLYIMPGNHDRRENMRAALSEYPYIPATGFIHYAIEEYPLRLICLDTLVEGEDYGLICQERLAWLKKTLEEEPAKPTLVFMHHPPVKTGTKLFDEIICMVPQEFEDLIREFKNILGILSGHYHHLCISSFGGKPCLIAPSVAPIHYFPTPHTDQVILELEDPAVVLHQWQGGTILTTHLHRIKEDYKRVDSKNLYPNNFKNWFMTCVKAPAV